MINWENETGWARHSHFGLRREWLELYLADREGWRRNACLGNRQVESLANWLKTCGIEDSKRRLTFLGQQFADKGTDRLELWELLWVNVVFNFPTARWYVHLGLGSWTTTELRSSLKKSVPRLADWTVSNAIMELAGILERTPVGSELGQGRVTADRPRCITRCGIEPCDAAIVHSLGRLYLQQQRGCLSWKEELTWPWVVFGCRREFVLGRLLFMDNEYFSVDEEGVVISTTDREGWLCGSIVTSFL